MPTARQVRFVQEYLVDLNATQAAIRAGYSTRTAATIGWELLRKPAIQALIATAQAERAARTGITQDWVLTELAKIARGTVKDLFHDDGRLKLPHELSDDAAARVASIEVVTRSTTVRDGDDEKPPVVEVEHVHKIRAWNKIDALVQVGRHLGMFREKPEETAQPRDMRVIVELVGGPGAPGTERQQPRPGAARRVNPADVELKG